MTTEEDFHGMLQQQNFSEMIKLLRLLALCYTEKTSYYPLPEGTKQWRIPIPLYGPEFAREYPDLNSAMPIKTIFLPMIEFFGMHVAYCQEIDGLAFWRDRNRSHDTYTRQAFYDHLYKDHPFCYICNQRILVTEYLTGTVDPGNITVSMHTKCANDKDLDVCRECQKIVKLEDLYGFPFSSCDSCRKKKINYKKEDLSTIVTDGYLEKIEELLKNTTPGPWARNPNGDGSVVTNAQRTILSDERTIRDTDGKVLGHFAGVCYGPPNKGNTKETWANLGFIAESRSLVPELIEEIRILKKLYFDLRGD